MPALPFSPPLLAVLLLLAIAHVCFLLFADYASRGLDALLVQGALKDAERVNLEQQKVRLFALVILAFEMALFLGSSAVRAEAPALSTALFVCATLLQTYIQQKLEIKAQRALAEQNKEPAAQAAEHARERMQALLRSLVALTVSVSLYGFTVLVCLRWALSAARAADYSNQAQSIVAFAASSGALLAGLTVHFLTTRLFVRLLHPARKLGKDVPEWELIKSAFAAAGMPAPAAYVWTQVLTSPRTVLVTGIRQIWPSVAVFIAPQALAELTPNQLYAVFAHEASHLYHHHLLKRLGLLVAALITTTLATSTALLALHPQSPLTLTLALAIGSWYAVSRAMTRGKLFQEIEADRTAVTRMGADAQALIEALGRLQQVQDWGQDLRIRVQLLERLAQEQSLARSVQEPQDQKKAA